MYANHQEVNRLCGVLFLLFLLTIATCAADSLLAERTDFNHFKNVRFSHDSPTVCTVETAHRSKGEIGIKIPSSFGGKRILVEARLTPFLGSCAVQVSSGSGVLNSTAPITPRAGVTGDQSRKLSLWVDIPKGKDFTANIHLGRQSKAKIHWLQVKTLEHQRPLKNSEFDENDKVYRPKEGKKS